MYHCPYFPNCFQYISYGTNKENLFNPVTHQKFCRKTRFEASRGVFWSLSCYKELKLTIKPYTGRTLRDPLIQVQNINLRSSFFTFFSFAGHLVGFILVGKVFRKAFRILGLDERKNRWVVEQYFYGNFQVNVTCFPMLHKLCSF